ncbi:MAG: fibronectin-binding protein [Mycobacterium sp.]
MSRIGTASVALIAAGAVMTWLSLSAPLIAGAPASPCTLALSLVCHFVPIEPDLDEDIDLTKPQPQRPSESTDPYTPQPGS